MDPALDYLAPLPQHLLGDYAALRARAFGGPLDLAESMIQRFAETTRGLSRGGELVAGLQLIPMGQFFGGARVSTWGVAAVAVAPHVRGRGVATQLMRAALGEMAEHEVAVSTLYPATFPLYRRVGYALAGGYYRISVPVAAIGALRERGAETTELRALGAGTEDEATVESLYLAGARTRQGWLDRGPYVWHRVRTGPGQGPTQGYLVLDQGAPAGYVRYRQVASKDPNSAFDLDIADLVVTTRAAGLRVLALFSDHRSVAGSATWYGSTDDACFGLLPERGAELALADPWMLRIVDVGRALEERGYARAVAARLRLRVVDPLLGNNDGAFIVDVAEGAARVERGGDGAIEMPVESLAALFSGHSDARHLAAMGQLRATPEHVEQLASVFPAGNPSLPDFF